MIGTRGTAAVELALMAPILVLAALGGADLARAAIQRAELEQTVRAFARFSTAQPGALETGALLHRFVHTVGETPLALRTAQIRVARQRHAARDWVIVSAEVPYRPLTPALARLLPEAMVFTLSAVEPVAHALR